MRQDGRKGERLHSSSSRGSDAEWTSVRGVKSREETGKKRRVWKELYLKCILIQTESFFLAG